jgi:hypothetical protein
VREHPPSVGLTERQERGLTDGGVPRCGIPVKERKRERGKEKKRAREREREKEREKRRSCAPT